MGVAAQGAAKLGGPSARIALLGELFEAFNERDVDAIASHYHPAAELWLNDVFTPPGTVYHGRSGVRTLLRDVLPSAGDMRSEILRTEEFPDAVFVVNSTWVDGEETTSYLVFT